MNIDVHQHGGNTWPERLRRLLIGLGVASVLLLLVENFDPIVLEFLVLSLNVPLALLIAATLSLGCVLGFVAARLLHARRCAAATATIPGSP